MAELLVASADAAKPAGAAPSGTLRAPVLLRHDGIPIEVSVHASPRAVMRELQHMFSGKKLKLSDRVLALPTTQHTAMELVNWGDDAAVEKDRCLECFVAFAESLRGALAARGHWCDFIDPCSGLPCHCKECTSIYDEVSGHQCLLKYAVSQAAGCACSCTRRAALLPGDDLHDRARRARPGAAGRVPAGGDGGRGVN
ncbi:hypothetical protein JL720_3775 [Aureococcus anophagefferens]|nr:hypothetical protein JL720_3775 [Aureococcus anophagefferens]